MPQALTTGAEIVLNGVDPALVQALQMMLRADPDEDRVQAKQVGTTHLDVVLKPAHVRSKARRSLEANPQRCVKFAVLPSLAAARWLIPLEKRAWALTALQAYTPYAMKARIGKAVLKALMIGRLRWARHGVSIASAEQLALAELVRDITGEQFPVFTLTIALPGRFRKLTIQAARPSGELLGYIKLPLTTDAADRIRHEAEILQLLQACPVLQGRVPKLLYSGKWAGGYILFESAGPSAPGPASFSRRHERFLHALSADLCTRSEQIELC